MNDRLTCLGKNRLRFGSRRAHRRWLKRQGLRGTSTTSSSTRAGLEALEQRTLLSATPVFELSDLLAVNGGDGSAGVIINGFSLNDRSGISVSSAGDVNADGYDDVIIGAFQDAPNGVDSGASFVVFGQAGGFNASLELSSLNGSNGFRINGISSGNFSGRAVASAGDINGDGFDDLLIGAFTASPNGAGSGQAYVVYGKSTAFTSTLELSSLSGANGFTINGVSAGDQMGFDLNGLGDVNGDGLDDFVLGAASASPNGAASGAAYVVFGQTGFGSSFDLTTLNGSNGFVIQGDSAGDSLGISVNGAGDVNADGLADVIVGAHLDASNGAGSGSAFVVFGKTSAFGATLDVSTLTGTNGFALRGAASDIAGRAVGSAGDFNGDGFDDVLIGALRSTGAVVDSGSAYVVYGQGGAFAASISLSALTGADGFQLDGIDAGDRAGLSVSAAGDTNGDGLDDLLVGARRASPNGTRSGEGYLVLGRSTATPASLNLSALIGSDGFVFNGIDALDTAADSLSYAGDVNGDGFADFIIGAPLADPNGGESGESYLIFGGDFSNAVTHLGLQVSDSVAGTAGGDVILGRRGDDILTGLGGADVILGGQGDDELIISDLNFIRVDGGSGTDTLVIRGSGISLDLTAVVDSRLRGLEAIDIRGGLNSLTLNLQEVLNLSDASNTLRVFRDGLGTVNIGPGWSQIGSQVVNGNQETTFTQGNATLVLAVELDILDPIVTVDPLATDVRSPGLTGTVVDLDIATTVQVTVNGTDYAAINNGDGTWTLPAGTISPDLADGIYEVLAVGTDTSSNIGVDTSTNELLIDNAAPVVTVDPLITNNNAPQLTGTVVDLDPATTVSVNVNGVDYAATNNGDGTWTLPAGTIGPVLPDGVYEVIATATDTVGHAAADSTTNELTIDTVLPLVTLDAPGATTDTSPQLTGTVTDLDPATAVVVTVNGVDYAAVNNGDTTWTLAQGTIAPALPEGDYPITVRATDTAGNQGVLGAPGNLTIDTAPVVTVDPRTTSDQRPELTGTVVDIDTAATVTVTVNGIAYTATNNGDGTWTLPDNTIAFADALADGVYDVSVSALDNGGNTGVDTTTNELTIDTSAPVVTVDSLYTKDTTPELTGTVSDTDATIAVTVNGVLHTAVNNGDGTWTLLDNTITLQLADGTYDVLVTATNAAVPPVDGSDVTIDELTIDTGVPVVTFDTLLTADTTPELTGTIVDADPNTVITVIITGGGGPLIAVNNGDGTWTVPNDTITTPLAAGTYAITVTAVDAAGNLGNHNNATGLTIDTVAPVVTVDPLTTGVVSPQLTGTVVDLDPATTVAVTVNGTVYAATNNGDGTWTLPAGTIAPDLADGTYDVLAVGTDTVGNSGNDLTAGELFVDTTVPVVTVDPQTTSDNTPLITGTVVDADPATTISVNVNGTDYAATNNGDGTWTLAAGTINPALADGVYEVVATATDTVGHSASDISTNELRIDTSGGVFNLSNLMPVNGGNGTLGVIFTGVADFDRSGNWVSSAGDINGDGLDDIVIGATGADGGGSQSGAVYVVFGQAGGFSAVFDLSTLNGTNGFRIDGLAAGDDLGVSVDSAGDVNGDGLDDLVLGASKVNTVLNNPGAAYIIYGQSTPFAAAFDLATLNGTNGYKFEGEATSDRAGFSVSGAGDINGDGLNDVIIGSLRGDDGVVIDGGRSYIIFGSTAVMPATMTAGALTGANGFIITGPDAGGRAGFNVSSAGDVNGDGISDVIVGAPITTIGGNTNAGKAFIVFGQAGGFSADLNLSTLNGSNGFAIEGNALDMEFGFNVSSIGDFNADGFGDVLIGAPESNQVAGTGSAYVVFGQAGAYPATMTLASLNGANGFKLQGVNVGDLAGFSVSGVGDVNGDGIEDLIVGALGGGPNPAADRGGAFLLFGSTAPFTANVTLSSIPGNGGLVFNGIDNLDMSGRSVSGAGDVNGDGFDDLLVSAREADVTNPNNDAGETYLIFGRDFTGDATQTGGAAGELFNGTAARDVILAGAGNDELVGNGGFDVLRGGAGDDIHGVLDTGFAKVAGGNGFDTLRLDGGGIVLDLTTIPDSRITGIERIDTRGSGINTLTVNALEVLNLSDTTNTLLILQNQTDTVNIGPGWTAAGTEVINSMTFDVFTQGEATVKLFTGADATAPVVTVDPLTTADTTPQLTGTVVDTDPLTTVEVTVNGIAYAATNNGDGTWTLADNTITPALAEGTYDVSVTATDSAANAGSDATTNELVVDINPVVTIDPLTTSDTTPQLTGTIIDVDPATTVQILVGGGVYAATNNGDGTWTLADNTITPALAEGTYNVIAIATDPASNIGSDSTTNELVVDVTLPVVTVDRLTTLDTTPQLTGTVDDTAAAVSVTVNGLVYAATNNGNGTWTLADNTITPALADGTYDVSVTATDAAGNVGSDATSNELLIDTTNPVVTIDLLTTSDTTPQLTGTIIDADPATMIQVLVGGGVYVATNNGDGTWTLADNTITPALAEATHQVIAIATDTAGNIGSDSTTNELIIQPPSLQGDVNNDGFVGVDDLNLVLLNWNQANPADARPDLNGDNFVGIDDLNLILTNWNAGTPPVVQAIATSMPVSAPAPTDVPVNDTTANAVAQPVSQVRPAPWTVVPVSASVEAPAPVQQQSAVTPDPLDREPSMLDQVKPQRPEQPGQGQEVDRSHAAAAWNWLHAEPRGLNTSFGLGEEDEGASSSALDMAKPLSEQSAISRLR